MRAIAFGEIPKFARNAAVTCSWFAELDGEPVPLLNETLVTPRSAPR